MHVAIKKNNHKTNQTTTQQKENKTQTTTYRCPNKKSTLQPFKDQRILFQRSIRQTQKHIYKSNYSNTKKNIKNITNIKKNYVSYVYPYITQTEVKPSSNTITHYKKKNKYNKTIKCPTTKQYNVPQNTTKINKNTK